MRSYLELMAQDERVIIINKEGVSHTLITFSLCNDIRPFVNKKLWDVIPHDPMGDTCYVEKIITDGWSKDIRLKLQDAILTKYSQVKWAVWYRPGKDNDRKVTRRIYETSLRN